MNRARRGAHQQQKPFVVGGVYQQNSPNNTTPSKTPRQQVLQQQHDGIQQVDNSLLEQKEPISKRLVIKESVNAAPKIENSLTGDGETDIKMAEAQANGDRKIFFKKIFAVRKKSSIRAKEKKIRQNRHLRKVILPKNALMALNEVKGIQIGDFVINSNTSGGFSAMVTVNQIQYEGRGVSKAVAKNSACEKALRDFVIAKMRQKPRRSSQTTSEPMDTSESNDVGGNESDGGNSVSTSDDADVPMINLASFALYKLFTEWENEGYEIPEFHAAAHGSQANQNASDGADKSDKPEKTPRKPHMRTELPPNWEEMHPATLLCMMRPGLAYNNWTTEGEKPNVTQTLLVTIDGIDFSGSGKSKKIARKNTAIAACNKLFDTNFSEED